MATLAQVVRSGKGKAHNWRVTLDDNGRDEHTLWHYSTPMLVWRGTHAPYTLIDCSTGHGSVSDQHGMNRAFNALDLPYHYSRRGGASIANTHDREAA